MEILNRKAKFDYFIEEELEAGIVLTGTEIKSIREGKCNIKDCYGIVKNGEVFLLNMYIAPYKEGNLFNHSETRSRKLLLHKKEIKKVTQAVNEQGLTLILKKISLKFYLVFVVVKRTMIRERQLKREILKGMF